MFKWLSALRSPAHEPTLFLPERAREAEDPDAVVQPLIGQCNHLRDHLSLGLDNLPRAAWIAYYTDFYHWQVNNGGHSQFYANCTPEKVEPGFVREAMAEMDMPEGLPAIFDEFMAWVEREPELAAAQTGFDDIPDTLNALDKRFYAINTDYKLSRVVADWVRKRPEVRYVPDETYYENFVGHYLRHPDLGPRLRKALLERLQRQQEDPTESMLRYALASLNPQQWLARAIPVAPMQDEAGQSVPVWNVMGSTSMMKVASLAEGSMVMEHGPAKGYGKGQGKTLGSVSAEARDLGPRLAKLYPIAWGAEHLLQQLDKRYRLIDMAYMGPANLGRDGTDSGVWRLRSDPPTDYVLGVAFNALALIRRPPKDKLMATIPMRQAVKQARKEGFGPDGGESVH
ncbi:MAG: DMP19 family protein [Gammaproteobacteria bacterium]